MSGETAWFTTHDGWRLLAQQWLPAGEPAAVVVLVHGFTEHSGRYSELAEHLCRRGHATCAIDLRGHGMSQGERAWVRSFDDYLVDVEGFLERVRLQYPEKRLFLLGHSMGATIVVLLAIDRSPPAHGLIVSAAALKIPARVFPVLRHLAVLASPVLPRLRVVSLGTKGLSRDPAVVADFERDPANFHGRFPVRTGAEILRAVRRIRARMENVRLPLLILHGSADAVADVAGARELYARAGSPDKTLRIYDGLYHDLFHEPEKEQVTADVVQWLEARVNPSATAGMNPPDGLSWQPD